jgi:hypothetical protein
VHHLAAQWIAGLLRDRNIPFLVCGGLAARAYGSDRDLNDIDLFVPGKHFAAVVQAGREFVCKAAEHRQEAGWDLTYVQFLYEGVKVEVGCAEDVRLFDADKQAWVSLQIDFSRYQTMHFLGLELPIMLKDDLVQYKSVLSRTVDVQDVRAIREGS